MPLPWGAMIGAGASLLGGMLGNQSDEKNAKLAAKQNQKNFQLAENQWEHGLEENQRQFDLTRADADALNKTRVQWLVEDARKAGIHPLAALGMSYQGSMASPIGAPSPTTPNTESYLQGNSLGAGVAGMAPYLADMFPNPLELEQQQLQNEALRADINYRKAGTAAILSEATSRTMIDKAREDYRGYDLYYGGANIKTDPRFSDQEAAETRYGEIVGEVYGLSAFAADMWKKLTEDRAAADAMPRPGDKFRVRHFR